MTPEEAIERLNKALSLATLNVVDKEAIRTLTNGITDEKHARYIEQGLESNDKSTLLHGIVGMLSHYEAEKEKLAQQPLEHFARR